jgi:hypothetical protein
MEELAARLRSPFVRCASLAGTGHAADGVLLNETDRIRLRQQSLEWLRADLARWSEVIASGPPSAQIVSRRTLTHWKCDLDLAPVREPDELAKLPEDERAAFVALWNELDALLDRAATNARGDCP